MTELNAVCPECGNAVANAGDTCNLSCYRSFLSALARDPSLHLGTTPNDMRSQPWYKQLI